MTSDDAGVLRIFDEVKVQRLAGPWARFFARLIDMTTFNIIGLQLAIFIVRHFFDLSHLNALGTLGFVPMSMVLVSFVSWILLALALTAVMTLFGTTPGKKLLGIRVTELGDGLKFLFYLRREFFVF